jgi:hypothetical protein
MRSTSRIPATGASVCAFSDEPRQILRVAGLGRRIPGLPAGLGPLRQLATKIRDVGVRPLFSATTTRTIGVVKAVPQAYPSRWFGRLRRNSPRFVSCRPDPGGLQARSTTASRTSRWLTIETTLASRTHPARGRRKLPPAPGNPRNAQNALLSPVIPAYSRLVWRHQDRPVTPEVAGSSPVAPVKRPAKCHVVLSV